MAILWIIFGIIHLVSIGIAIAIYLRLYGYIRRFRFDESKYTLLFGFVHLHWVHILYFAFVIAWVPFSFYLIL